MYFILFFFLVTTYGKRKMKKKIRTSHDSSDGPYEIHELCLHARLFPKPPLVSTPSN